MTAGLASLQVAAYGGKLRYTLSYTAGAHGSPLSDPDVQITVSTWLPAGRAEGEGGNQQPPSVSLSYRPRTQLAWRELGAQGPWPPTQSG